MFETLRDQLQFMTFFPPICNLASMLCYLAILTKFIKRKFKKNPNLGNFLHEYGRDFCGFDICEKCGIIEVLYWNLLLKGYFHFLGLFSNKSIIKLNE
jgi:hypothetical protein